MFHVMPQALLHSNDHSVCIITDLLTVCTIQTLRAEPCAIEDAATSIHATLSVLSESMFPFSALVPMVPVWYVCVPCEDVGLCPCRPSFSRAVAWFHCMHDTRQPCRPAAKLAFQLQALVAVSMKHPGPLPDLAPVPPTLPTPVAPPAPVYPNVSVQSTSRASAAATTLRFGAASSATSSGAAAAYSGLAVDGLSEPGDGGKYSQYVPDWGTFVYVPELQQCRAVFVDRTICVKRGPEDVKFILPDGSVLLGTVEDLELNEDLRCVQLGVCLLLPALPCAVHGASRCDPTCMCMTLLPWAMACQPSLTFVV